MGQFQPAIEQAAGRASPKRAEMAPLHAFGDVEARGEFARADVGSTRWRSIIANARDSNVLAGIAIVERSGPAA